MIMPLFIVNIICIKEWECKSMKVKVKHDGGSLDGQGIKESATWIWGHAIYYQY